MQDAWSATVPFRPGEKEPGGDYALVRRSIAFVNGERDDQLDLDRLAAHLGVSGAGLRRAFERWCGLTPEGFVRAGSAEYVRDLLDRSMTVFEVAGPVIHNFPVTVAETITDDVRRRGEGLDIAYGFHDSPFGDALVMSTGGGVCGIAFVDEDAGQTQRETLADMTGRWPRARYREAPDETGPIAARIFGASTASTQGAAVPLALIGTPFDIRVWQTLLRIPVGRLVSYTDIARHLGQPTASRAVGTANGRNPISFVVPCHRALRSDGTLGGYYWGLTRKRALIAWETGRAAERALNP